MTAVTDHDLVLVVDFGAQYAQLIARRVREARVYSEIVPHTMPVDEMLARNPKAIILSGGPSSVYDEGAPGIDPALFDGRDPGVRHVLRLPADGPGARRRGRRTPGRASTAAPPSTSPSPAPCSPTSPPPTPSWMSHGDSVAAAPAGFTVLASHAGDPGGGVRGTSSGGLAGVQWHPEVLHTEHGQQVLEHFLHDIAGCRQTWTMLNIVEEQVETIRAQIGDGSRDLRALRRRRLRRRRRHRAARDRRPAHLRLRRPRA